MKITTAFIPENYNSTISKWFTAKSLMTS